MQTGRWYVDFNPLHNLLVYYRDNNLTDLRRRVRERTTPGCIVDDGICWGVGQEDTPAVPDPGSEICRLAKVKNYSYLLASELRAAGRSL